MFNKRYKFNSTVKKSYHTCIEMEVKLKPDFNINRKQRNWSKLSE